MPFSAGLRPAVPTRGALPAAVSELTVALLEGAPVRATVLGVHAPALYLDVAGRVLPVVTSDAVPLPTALRLAVPSGRVDWAVATGDVATVGGGLVTFAGFAGFQIAAVRTWRPARVRLTPRDERGSGGSGSHFRTHDGWLADGIRTTLADPERGVDVLLGRGPGLTPSGDDALAGILLVTRAVGLAGPLAAAVRSRLASTTAVSAALLDAAADGYAGPDVVALVDAALAGDDATISRAMPAVLAIGHTSGADLVAGIGGALHHLTDSTTGRSAA